METPIFGGFYVSRSTNLADQQCNNLFPTTVDTRTGKAVGALYATPGLDLVIATGGGAIRPGGMQVFLGTLYVVNRANVFAVTYSATDGYQAMLIGAIGSNAGPVSIINNGKQLAIFDGTNGYLLPGGVPLTGGTISNGGTQYAVGDLINLIAQDGTQNATAQVEVTTVSAGVVTGFTVVLNGAFGPDLPTTLSQSETSGSGDGFTLDPPTFGASVPLYMLTLPFSNPVSASYQDGFGLVVQGGSQIIWQSDLFDLSYFDPLNFSSADAQPDNIQAIAELHEEQFIFKETNIEVWINAGVAGFAFQRLAGVHIEIGCVAPASVAKAAESLVWLSQDDQGAGMVYAVEGYVPKKISTKSIDGAIQSYPTISDAVGYCYQQDGHLYYVLTFPSGNATWVFDFATSLWHQRSTFANGLFSRHWGIAYAYFNGKNIIGDYRNGNLYAINLNTQTDNGVPKKWVRTWRALPKPNYMPMTFSSLQIDMETGIQVPPGTNPQVVLRWSDDGGHNWSNEYFAAAGKTGDTAIRVMFRRLGSTRLDSGLDRIFELSSSDPFMTAIINADLQYG